MSHRSIIEQAIARHRAVLDALAGDLDAIAEAAGAIGGALRAGNKLMLCGNGGSAASAQHFAAEWMARYKNDRRPYPAIALSTDTSVLTAIGNDYGYEQIFSRQVEALGAPGDVLIALSTSGRSPNVLKALEIARNRKMRTVFLTGKQGKNTAADIVIAVPDVETARIQEMHDLILHAWCEAVDAVR